MKVTLRELRDEAKRVAPAIDLYEGNGLDFAIALGRLHIFDGSRNRARRLMLQLLKNLPDGALNEY